MSEVLLCKFDFTPDMTFVDFSERIEKTKVKTSHHGLIKYVAGMRKLPVRKTNFINTRDKTSENRIKSEIYSMTAAVHGLLLHHNVNGTIVVAICAEMLLGKIMFVGRSYVQNQGHNTKKNTI